MRARTAALIGAALLNQARWARRTRPEPLPAAPAGSRTVRTRDGLRLHAQVGGVADGPVTVVLVHGLLARTLEWEMQWSALSAQARLVRYDHRSHGRSEHSGRSATVQQLADDLACVLEQLVPTGPVVLVGHSMGGMTVLALAEHHPAVVRDRVVGVALLATGAGHIISGHRLEDLCRLVGRRGLLGPALLSLRLSAPALERLRPRRTHTLRWAVRKVAFGTADVDPATLAMTQQLLEEPPLATLASLQGSVLRNDTRAGLAEIARLPVLVVTGSDDRLTRPEHSRRMAADLGDGCELVVVPGAGHVLNQTRPDVVNAALRRLLARCTPTTAVPAATSAP